MMIVRTALRNLRRQPRRSAAIGVTVALAAGALLLFHGFNAGIMNQYRDNTIHARYGHGQINRAGYREQAHEEPWRHWITGWDELETRLQNFPGVERLFPRVEFFALLSNGRTSVSGRGQGVDGAQEAEFFHTLNVESGVTLSGQADGILLGRGLARALDVVPGDRITLLGNTIEGTLNGLDLTVVGIFHTGAKEFDDMMFRIQLEQAWMLLDTDLVESIAIGLRDIESWPAFAARVTAELTGLEAVPFAVLDRVYYQHSVDWLDAQFGFIRGIILTFLVLAIFTTASAAVLERKQEIGNLRANGESTGDVVGLLAWEGLSLGALGAVAGMLLCWGICATVLADGLLMPPAPGLTRQFQVRIELQPMMAMIAFALTGATTVVATVAAGWRVARMPIGEALRAS